jgi:signal-transduction protein with cAMP-binding, CBS, and nucleotidyltransferase domain
MSTRHIIRVKDVMKDKFDIIEGLASVRQALDAMKYAHTKTLIINKRHDDDEYGIVVIPDIAKEVLAKDRSPDRVSVYEIMTKPAVTVDPEMDIRYASRLFARLGLSRAPVVDGGKVVGIVSYSDMVLKGLMKFV